VTQRAQFSLAASAAVTGHHPKSIPLPLAFVRDAGKLPLKTFFVSSSISDVRLLEEESITSTMEGIVLNKKQSPVYGVARNVILMI
jgi:hypothetical protein